VGEGEVSVAPSLVGPNNARITPPAREGGGVSPKIIMGAGFIFLKKILLLLVPIIRSLNKSLFFSYI
jgi:hypothetical protein